MPVTAEIGCLVWHDDEVKGSRLDRSFTAGTDVAFPGRISLNGCDGQAWGIE